MDTFRDRLSDVAKEHNSGLILALDHDLPPREGAHEAIKNLKKLAPYLCGIKLNFHLLLPLGAKRISAINNEAHAYGLQTIADIKLNDIGNTNHIAARNLWMMGFDALIANPIMGPDSLRSLTEYAHKTDKGIITLCHMSAPEARVSYELQVTSDLVDDKQQHNKMLYHYFLRWAIKSSVDGIIIGATFPNIIKECASQIKHADIFSPGVGVQGGNATQTIKAGARYIIVGRSILGADDPVHIASNLQKQAFGN